jgi:hypothetical protein
MVGSGPFKFVKDEFQPGHHVVYVKNPDYVPRSEPSSWASGGKVAKVDRVEWLNIPDAMTKVAALNAGEADWWENPPLDVVPVLAANSDIPARSLVAGCGYRASASIGGTPQPGCPAPHADQERGARDPARSSDPELDRLSEAKRRSHHSANAGKRRNSPTRMADRDAAAGSTTGKPAVRNTLKHLLLVRARRSVPCGHCGALKFLYRLTKERGGTRTGHGHPCCASPRDRLCAGR